MSTYVLVHGAWLGAWNWYKLAPLLEQAGHRVIIFDLPGHGEDHTPVTVISLQSYVERLTQVLDQQAEPVMLVAHSMGGVVASQAAEQRPDRIKTIVYLSAYLLRTGESLFQIASTDKDAQVGHYFVVNETQGIIGISEEGLKAVFFHDCSDEDVARAKALSHSEPLAPLAIPVSITEQRYGRVPRVYIETLLDRVVSPPVQKQMYTATPCRQVFSLETGHASFFAAPEKLAAHLISLNI